MLTAGGEGCRRPTDEEMAERVSQIDLNTYAD